MCGVEFFLQTLRLDLGEELRGCFMLAGIACMFFIVAGGMVALLLRVALVEIRKVVVPDGVEFAGFPGKLVILGLDKAVAGQFFLARFFSASLGLKRSMILSMNPAKPPRSMVCSRS